MNLRAMWRAAKSTRLGPDVEAVALLYAPPGLSAGKVRPRVVAKAKFGRKRPADPSEALEWLSHLLSLLLAVKPPNGEPMLGQVRRHAKTLRSDIADWNSPASRELEEALGFICEGRYDDTVPPWCPPLLLRERPRTIRAALRIVLGNLVEGDASNPRARRIARSYDRSVLERRLHDLDFRTPISETALQRLERWVVAAFRTLADRLHVHVIGLQGSTGRRLLRKAIRNAREDAQDGLRHREKTDAWRQPVRHIISYVVGDMDKLRKKATFR